MQQSTSDSGRRRSGGGGGGASLTRAGAGRLASGPCLRRCEDGRGRLRRNVELAIIMSMMAQTIQCEGCARSGSAPT